MNTITVTLAGKTVEVDEEGFLENRSDWNEEIAKEMAKADKVELTPEHWEIINFMRAYYDEYQISPSARALHKAIGKKLGPEKGKAKYLYELFPEGPAKQANKFAGLPRLMGGCV